MKPVEDAGRIAKVMRHPAIWPYVSDDNTPQDWQPEIHPARVYLMPDDDSACFVFSQHSGCLAEGHFCVLPEHRHKSDELAEQAMQWLRDNTDTRALVGFINAANKAARNYVKRLGFHEGARLPNAALRGGNHMDVVIYTKEL